MWRTVNLATRWGAGAPQRTYQAPVAKSPSDPGPNHKETITVYLFNRSGTAKREHFIEARAYAVEIAAKVTTITGRPITAFSGTFGYPLGTLSWSTRFETHADMHDMFAKLAADPGYVEIIQRNAHMFDSWNEDTLVNVVSSTLTPTPRPIYEVTTAVVANGKLAAAMAFGVKAQEYVAKATGFPTAFVAQTYGPFGAVGWLTGASDMAEAEKIQDMWRTDTTFATMVDEGGDLFIPGAARNGLIEKVD